MQRRVSLPGADELFRPTQEGELPSVARAASPDAPPGEPQGMDEPDERRGSGRVRHDEKMTVYVTADELFELEHARLSLRRDHGIAVDRGRLVREAVSIALADLAERGADAEIVVRLCGRPVERLAPS
ncbi:MAG: hypothetical protein H0U77_01530 [Nocardioidaceae bacterium]|nr:hypothetical protein [Nocardioidaceae bacterium]